MSPWLVRESGADTFFKEINKLAASRGLFHNV